MNGQNDNDKLNNNGSSQDESFYDGTNPENVTVDYEATLKNFIDEQKGKYDEAGGALRNIPYKKFKKWYFTALILNNELFTDEMFLKKFNCNKTLDNIIGFKYKVFITFMFPN